MADNIFLGPDAQVRFSLQMLRAYEGRGKIAAEQTPIIDGVFLSTDPDANVTGEYEASAANLLKLRIRPGKNPARWQAMHLVMGPLDLGDAAVIGVVARSQAPSSFTTRICLRSGQDGQFVDTFFPKTMVSFAQTSTHLDVLEISKLTDLPRQAQWRDLILFFQGSDVDLNLLDLRFFVV
ncbi:hypothetical protein H4P12_17775 [Paracoccus sp. 11-3]|uniref:Uncharacterized protein n=1 Tax=Paracoccus amoyensis TaxID=2760093 RepID=A0A926JE56_9RHOB|nr:hypothetical protein [Paracoccus amoyensis]MBC9248514.1 hypothetical protein [Paracoccus amoyensis]